MTPITKSGVSLSPQDMRQMLRVAESILLSRAQLVGDGKTFQGNRDMYVTLGYRRELLFEHYVARFKRDGLARRVVKAIADATWRGVGGELVENEDPNVVTAFEAAWFELSDRLKVWNVFRRADILAGLGRYAVILIGAPGDLERELPPTMKSEDIFFLEPYAEPFAVISKYEDNVQNPRYGKPTEYMVSLVAPNNKVGAGNVVPTVSKPVHHSRIIHIADGLENVVLGSPRLEPSWNYFDDLDKVRGGGAEAFWQMANPAMQWDLDPTVTFQEGEEDALDEEVESLMDGMKRHIKTRGLKGTKFASDPANFDKNLDALISLIAASSEIPQRILMGSERGNLASEEDRNNWAERVQDRRQEFGGPICVKPFVDNVLIKRQVLPTPKSYEVNWPTQHDASDEEKVKLALGMTQANQANAASGGGVVFASEEIRDRSFGMDPLDPKVQAEIDARKQEENAAKAPVVDPNKDRVAAEKRRYALVASVKRRTWLRNNRRATAV